MKETYIQVVRKIGGILEEANIPYQFTGQGGIIHSTGITERLQ